jgi:hypothetical protein
VSPRIEHAVVQWVVPMLLIVLIPVGVTIYMLNQQREDSCKATITALDGVRETAQAGLREPVSLKAISVFTEEQQEFALQQREQTIRENARRKIVIVRMTKAIGDLRSSDFCQ